MEMEQYFQEMNEDGASLKSWNSKSPPVDETENNDSSGFDCNICLDSVQDPVVTVCGHLYCWPCIYKWIHYQSNSSENSDHQEPKCPVCKAEVSQKTLIPLYGRGLSTASSSGKAPSLGIIIPQRPQNPRCAPFRSNPPHAHQIYHHGNHPQQPGGFIASPALNRSGSGPSISHPVVGMFGEMVYSRIFGNSENTLYTYPNSYHLAGSASPRIRRHVMEVDKSLSRLCFFLFCCMVLCLLLF